EALDHERLEVRAGGVQRSRVAGGAAADDDHVLDLAHGLSFLTRHSVHATFAHYFTLYSIAVGGWVSLSGSVAATPRRRLRSASRRLQPVRCSPTGSRRAHHQS